MATIHLTVITDASFANGNKHRRQLGFVILITDGKVISNLIHYGSSRCKRVTRSILAAEVHALVYGYDQEFVIRNMLAEVLGRLIPLEAYVDSRSVFEIIAKDGNTAEKRLQIDIFALRESYSNGELEKIGWIPGPMNPADALKKTVTCTGTELSTLIATNKISLDPIGWASFKKGDKRDTRRHARDKKGNSDDEKGNFHRKDEALGNLEEEEVTKAE